MRFLSLGMHVLTVLSVGTVAMAQTEKPLNFLMIWGDDIGYWNISAYNMGMMGYKTPNIDRLAQPVHERQRSEA